MDELMIGSSSWGANDRKLSIMNWPMFWRHW
jgi:hypothetical protein